MLFRLHDKLASPLTIGLLVGAALVWIWVRPSPEAAAESSLHTLAQQLNDSGPGELEAIVTSATTNSVTLKIPDHPRLGTGRSAVLGWLDQKLGPRRPRLGFVDLQTRLVSPEEAWIQGRVQIDVVSQQEIRSDTRRFDAKLLRTDKWRIAWVDVAAPTHEQPEARP